MAIREPKIRTRTEIDVIGRPGGRKGRIELTSGNLIYFRAGAKTETLRLTYQQLFSILESEIEYRAIVPEQIKLPPPLKSGDFTLSVRNNEDWISGGEDLFYAQLSTKHLDPRRFQEGAYEFSYTNLAPRKRKKHIEWSVSLSLQAAVWILNHYIDKFLCNRKMSAHTDKEVVISKQKIREVILFLLKKVDP